MRQPYVIFSFALTFIALFFLPEETKISLLTSPAEILYLPSLPNTGKALLAGFMHLNFAHLFGNLTLFVLLGYVVEEKLGHWRTLLLLLASGVGALAVHVGYLPMSNVKFLGASGFVFGLLAAYTKCLFRHNHPWIKPHETSSQKTS